MCLRIFYILLLTGRRSVFCNLWQVYIFCTTVNTEFWTGERLTLYFRNLWILWSFLKISMCVIKIQKHRHLFRAKNKTKKLGYYPMTFIFCFYLSDRFSIPCKDRKNNFPLYCCCRCGHDGGDSGWLGLDGWRIKKL